MRSIAIELDNERNDGLSPPWIARKFFQAVTMLSKCPKDHLSATSGCK